MRSNQVWIWVPLQRVHLPCGVPCHLKKRLGKRSVPFLRSSNEVYIFGHQKIQFFRNRKSWLIFGISTTLSLLHTFITLTVQNSATGPHWMLGDCILLSIRDQIIPKSGPSESPKNDETPSGGTIRYLGYVHVLPWPRTDQFWYSVRGHSYLIGPNALDMTSPIVGYLFILDRIVLLTSNCLVVRI